MSAESPSFCLILDICILKNFILTKLFLQSFSFSLFYKTRWCSYCSASEPNLLFDNLSVNGFPFLQASFNSFIQKSDKFALTLLNTFSSTLYTFHTLIALETYNTFIMPCEEYNIDYVASYKMKKTLMHTSPWKISC